MGTVTNLGVLVPREPAAAGRGLGRACDLGAPKACVQFINFVKDGGDRALAASCDKGDAFSCFYLATALHLGKGVSQDESRSLSLFERSCKEGYVRGCGVAGEMYLNGQGAAADSAKALGNLEKSCAGGWAQSCVEAATVYRRQPAGPQNEELAEQRLQQGCNLGDEVACRMLTDPALLDPPYH
jgi:TPR repeat protein